MAGSSLKDIQLSSELMTNEIRFLEKEKLWKSKFFIDYRLKEEYLEDTVTVFYSSDGAVERMENEKEEPLYRPVLTTHSLNIFGEELTVKINEWIKKELKLRYFF